MTRPRIGSSGHHFERIRNIAFGLHRDEVEGKFPTLTVEQLDILFNENPSPTWTNFDKQILNIIRKHCFEVFDLDPEQREEKSAIIQDLLENAAEIIPQPSTQEHYHQNPEHYYHKGKMILTNDGWRLLADAVEFRAPSITQVKSLLIKSPRRISRVFQRLPLSRECESESSNSSS